MASNLQIFAILVAFLSLQLVFSSRNTLDFEQTPIQEAETSEGPFDFIKGIFPVDILKSTKRLALDDSSRQTYNLLNRAEKLGYPAEEHFVTTKDGYILRLYRIQAKNTTMRNGLRTIFMQHGLGDSSDTFIVNDEELALGLLIANEIGADVWFGNNRGNKHSKNHTSFDPFHSEEFWDFSFDEFAEHDLPAMLSYVSTVANSTKIDYIGHSQGSTQMFAALANKVPEVHNLVDRIFSLGPVAYLYGLSSPMGKLALRTPALNIVEYFGIKEVFPYTDFLNFASHFGCQFSPFICQMIITLISDRNGLSYDNNAKFFQILSYMPGGASVRQLRHFQQLHLYGSPADPIFSKFDHGPEKNLLKYGTHQPPRYDLSLIEKQFFLYQGLEDMMSSVNDGYLLMSQLKNSKVKHYTYENMGHLTYMWGNGNQEWHRFKADLLRDLTLADLQ